jgi:hypothetical protein
LDCTVYALAACTGSGADARSGSALAQKRGTKPHAAADPDPESAQTEHAPARPRTPRGGVGQLLEGVNEMAKVTEVITPEFGPTHPLATPDFLTPERVAELLREGVVLASLDLLRQIEHQESGPVATLRSRRRNDGTWA